MSRPEELEPYVVHSARDVAQLAAVLAAQATPSDSMRDARCVERAVQLLDLATARMRARADALDRQHFRLRSAESGRPIVPADVPGFAHTSEAGFQQFPYQEKAP